MTRTVWIRVDASYDIGSGHVMRCLTLADELRTKGCTVQFVCRAWPGHLEDTICRRGYSVHLLPASADGQVWSWTRSHQDVDAFETLAAINSVDPIACIVVDHYALDASWETHFFDRSIKVLVIDDLADRYHRCTWLLDQNLRSDGQTPYATLIPSTTQLLCGPRYALLRPQFAKWRSRLRPRDGAVHRILVTYGGTDPTGETIRCLLALADSPYQSVAVDVLFGPQNPSAGDIHVLCEHHPSWTDHGFVDNVGEMMANADLCLGAGGGSTWERCCLGLPSIVTVVAENQREAAMTLQNLGAQKVICSPSITTVDTYRHVLQDVSPAMLKEMSTRSLALVDGLGCGRVAATLLEGIE